MSTQYTAFDGARVVSTGSLAEVLNALVQQKPPLPLVFEHSTGAQVDFDLRGTPDEVLARALPEEVRPAGPGRPRLGVVSAEVTLLPRHWNWLNAQGSRASGTLRRLVDEAMAREARSPRKRWEALGKILWAVAGNADGFEEASRALYSGDADKLRTLTRSWPGDLPAFVDEWIESTTAVAAPTASVNPY